jgi:hypothetical protein
MLTPSIHCTLKGKGSNFPRQMKQDKLGASDHRTQSDLYAASLLVIAPLPASELKQLPLGRAYTTTHEDPFGHLLKASEECRSFHTTDEKQHDSVDSTAVGIVFLDQTGSSKESEPLDKRSLAQGCFEQPTD